MVKKHNPYGILNSITHTVGMLLHYYSVFLSWHSYCIYVFCTWIGMREVGRHVQLHSYSNGARRRTYHTKAILYNTKPQTTSSISTTWNDTFPSQITILNRYNWKGFPFTLLCADFTEDCSDFWLHWVFCSFHKIHPTLYSNPISNDEEPTVYSQDLLPSLNQSSQKLYLLGTSVNSRGAVCVCFLQ